jgi:hypothetical protein
MPRTRAPAHGLLARRPGGSARSCRACPAARTRGRPAREGRRRSPRRRSPPKSPQDERRPCAVPSGALQTSRLAVDRLVGPPPNAEAQLQRRVIECGRRPHESRDPLSAAACVRPHLRRARPFALPIQGARAQWESRRCGQQDTVESRARRSSWQERRTQPLPRMSREHARWS